MNITIPFIFFTIAIIQIGIFINSISIIKIYPNEKALKYWAGSLILSSIGITAIAVGAMLAASLHRGTFFSTINNTIHFISIISLIFYAKNLKKEITAKDKKVFTLLTIFYFFGFEIIRKNGDFIDRQTFTACMGVIAYFLLLLEIRQQKLFNDSYYLKVFAITSIIEFILIIIRVIVLLSNDYGFIDSLNDVPLIPTLLLWILLMVNVWSYISINGYWTERISNLNTTNLIENTKIKLLLNEKYKLINSLVTANKTAISSALSASIAHEINQPLGAMKTNSQHLNLLIKGKKEKILIKSIIKDNDRAAKIITTLKSMFSNNKSIYRSEIFDTFVQSLEPIFKESIKEKNIRIKFLLNSSAKVNMNTDELRQVFSNLIQNSIDALSLTSKKNKVIKIKTFTKNNKLFCSVTDNGPGISRKIQGKIFKLYESSKISNSGIGLWLSKYIITRHKGSLSVNKAYLSGAEFLIELPISNNV
ncbi:sensor histidine kinase [Candidatus Methylopumilus universalis]|uniref:sensor histidine kinase n=1 Tax=Candidatus Methylopumilus universalis TaxID=2588536 RepID=UPI0011246C9C|nr:HAMP domain-containing sensor histidine kinase [Candidatus Methylopumilus universalis]QDC80102.1 HAMP domain-containing histidine kinase [Candidatus Methylopumilus universalis]QDC81403.1 HAMP domain-containing histidine kinase [Candidatus Methylopumilus universalis]QDC87842.1 HAMP domain-containing histidine kinase [Candidatus Methylopumilus universalis]